MLPTFSRSRYLHHNYVDNQRRRTNRSGLVYVYLQGPLPILQKEHKIFCWHCAYVSHHNVQQLWGCSLIIFSKPFLDPLKTSHKSSRMETSFFHGILCLEKRSFKALNTDLVFTVCELDCCKVLYNNAFLT